MSDDLRDERDEDGKLTDMALACDALADHGCDCGEDEPGTCLACLCEKALMTERARAEKAEAELARIEPVYEAAVAYRKGHAKRGMLRHNLFAAVDSVEAMKEGKS